MEPKTPAEKRAAKLASEAIGADYWSGHYAVAEKKLREAIQICLVQSCTVPFQARLHRDLGVVYVAGMKRVEDGKDEFAMALAADTTVILAASMDTPPVRKAFVEVKAGATNPPASAAPPDAETPAPSSAEATPGPEPEPDDAASRPRRSKRSRHPETEPVKDVAEPPEVKNAQRFLNWFSLGVQQDFMIHSQTSNACSPGSRYSCFDATGRPIPLDPAVVVAGGNQISVGGVTSGTLRVLAGYDRVIGRRFSLGLRAGSVLTGKADSVQGDRAFMYFHGEARAAVWLARDPFASAGVHPYLFLSGGVAEADGKVLVEYTDKRQTCTACKLDAWKRSGNGFIGMGLGIHAAITPRSGPILEARYMQFFGPSAPVIGAQLGYTVGF